MAVKKGKTDVLDLFPMQSVKTTYVSVHQLKDYKSFKEEKPFFRLKKTVTELQSKDKAIKEQRSSTKEKLFYLLKSLQN